jgi:hypothetical protein
MMHNSLCKLYSQLNFEALIQKAKTVKESPLRQQKPIEVEIIKVHLLVKEIFYQYMNF